VGAGDKTDGDTYHVAIHVAMNDVQEQWVRVISYENAPGNRRPQDALYA
jgi:hypothetical protein